MSELVRRFESAKIALGEEAEAIMATSPAYRDSDRVGPYGAVTLTMEALWQKPELVDALAAYFRVLRESREGDR